MICPPVPPLLTTSPLVLHLSHSPPSCSSDHPFLRPLFKYHLLREALLDYPSEGGFPSPFFPSPCFFKSEPLLPHNIYLNVVCPTSRVKLHLLPPLVLPALVPALSASLALSPLMKHFATYLVGCLPSKMSAPWKQRYVVCPLQYPCAGRGPAP